MKLINISVENTEQKWWRKSGPHDFLDKMDKKVPTIVVNNALTLMMGIDCVCIFFRQLFLHVKRGQELASGLTVAAKIQPIEFQN